MRGAPTNFLRFEPSTFLSSQFSQLHNPSNPSSLFDHPTKSTSSDSVHCLIKKVNHNWLCCSRKTTKIPKVVTKDPSQVDVVNEMGKSLIDYFAVHCSTKDIKRPIIAHFLRS